MLPWYNDDAMSKCAATNYLLSVVQYLREQGGDKEAKSKQRGAFESCKEGIVQ